MTSSETQPDEAGSQPVTTQTPKASRALSGLKRELTDEELASPGVQKMLLDYLERAQEENNNLRTLRERFHEVDKELSVLQEKFNTNVAVEVVSVATLTIGAAALVYTPELWEHQPVGWMSLLFGIILIAVGIVAKCLRV